MNKRPALVTCLEIYLLKKIPRRVNRGDKIHVVPLVPVHGEAGHDVGQLLDEPLVVPRLAHPVIACKEVT